MPTFTSWQACQRKQGVAMFKLTFKAVKVEINLWALTALLSAIIDRFFT
jgi:hypothetical protein